MIRMLIRFVVAAMVMFCTLDAFGASAELYTTDHSIVCSTPSPISYFASLVDQGDEQAAIKLGMALVKSEQCVMSRPGITVYVIGNIGKVLMIRPKGEYVPLYTLRALLTNARPKTKADEKNIKVPELQNF